jgi:hypothetical protein
LCLLFLVHCDRPLVGPVYEVILALVRNVRNRSKRQEERGGVFGAGQEPCKPKSTALRDQGADHSPSILSTNSQRGILMSANQVICGTSANIGR